MARRRERIRLPSDLARPETPRVYLRLLYILWRIVRFALITCAETPTRRARGYSPLYLRIRRELEHLGTTFVKFGQYLAIREDLLPKELCSELSNLYFNVDPLSYEAVRHCIESELGRLAFAAIDPEPIAAASIAQVHRAVSRDGRWLAVKILRPGTEEILRVDLYIIARLAALADSFRWFASICMTQLAREVAEFTLREVDFTAEAEAAKRLAAAPIAGVRIPQIEQDLSTRHLLTMEFIEGVTFLDVIRRGEAGSRDPFAEILPGVDPRRVAANCATAFFTQIFVTGFFHGDPHPANIIIEPDGTVALVDFGIVAELDRKLRDGFARYVEFVATGRIERAASTLLGLVAPSSKTDILAYRKDLIAFMRQWYDASRRPGSPVTDKLQARYQAEMFKVMRRHHVTMPLNHLLFWKALASLDSTFHRMPTDYDLLTGLANFFSARALRELPRKLIERYERAPIDMEFPLAILDRSGGDGPRGRWAVISSQFQRQRLSGRVNTLLMALLTVSFAVVSFIAVHALRTTS